MKELLDSRAAAACIEFSFPSPQDTTSLAEPSKN